MRVAIFGGELNHVYMYNVSRSVNCLNTAKSKMITSQVQRTPCTAILTNLMPAKFSRYTVYYGTISSVSLWLKERELIEKVAVGLRDGCILGRRRSKVILVLQDGFLLRARDLHVSKDDGILALSGPIFSRRPETHGRRERVGIGHHHFHHTAEHWVLLPTHQTNCLWVVRCQNLVCVCVCRMTESVTAVVRVHHLLAHNLMQ